MAYTATQQQQQQASTKAKLLQAYHSDSFLLTGTVTTYQGHHESGSARSKLTGSVAQYLKLSITNKVGTTYNVVIFSDQAPEIWELSKLSVGASISLLIHKADYGYRYGDCHRVNSVVNQADIDLIRASAADPMALKALCLLQGIDSSTYLTSLISTMVQNSSQGWKFSSMPLHRATPL